MTRSLHHEDGVRAALARLLEHQPADDVWRQLVDGLYVEDVTLAAGGPLETERLLGLAEMYRKLAGVPAPASSPAENSAMRALESIVSGEAAARDDVQSFRSEMLGGALIAGDAVHGWVEARAGEEDAAGFVRELRALVECHGGDVSTVVDLVGPLLLSYLVPDDDWVRSRRVHPVGTLARLRRISESLAGAYEWHPAAATTFVLTGRAARVPISRVSVRLHAALPALDRIVLDVSPRVSPLEVRDLYAQRRQEYAEQRFGSKERSFRHREPSNDTLQLAVFVAEHYREARSWAALHELWEAQGIGRAYADWKPFTTAARRAYELVTGAPLPWDERHREMTSTPTTRTED